MVRSRLSGDSRVTYRNDYLLIDSGGVEMKNRALFYVRHGQTLHGAFGSYSRASAFGINKYGIGKFKVLSTGRGRKHGRRRR